MLNDLDNFYLEQKEPAKSCLQALRIIILKFNPKITEVWKFCMPFFCLNGKMVALMVRNGNQTRPFWELLMEKA